MQRTLYLSSIPQPLLQQLANSYHFRAIAPAPQAARALQVPHQNLKTFAQKLFRTNGLTIAPPLTAYRTPNGLALLDYKTSSTKPAGVKNELGKEALALPIQANAGERFLYPGDWHSTQPGRDGRTSLFSNHL